MKYTIEGVVKTFSSNGEFTIHGSEGYFHQKKDDESYNLFWENSENNSGKESGPEKNKVLNLVAIPQKVCKLQVPTDGRQWEFQLLSIAKATSQKVRVEMESVREISEKNSQPIDVVSVTLL